MLRTVVTSVVAGVVTLLIYEFVIEPRITALRREQQIADTAISI